MRGGVVPSLLRGGFIVGRTFSDGGSRVPQQSRAGAPAFFTRERRTAVDSKLESVHGLGSWPGDCNLRSAPHSPWGCGYNASGSGGARLAGHRGGHTRTGKMRRRVLT